VTVPVRWREDINERLDGIRWFATTGKNLPPAVERIVVLDATDLKHLPIKNESRDKFWGGVDVEKFWRGPGRTPTRVILRFVGEKQTR